MRVRKWVGLSVMVGLALAAAVSAQESAQTKQAEPAKQDAKPQAPATAAKPVAATTDPNYQIGADDVLDVNVWNEPQISRSVPVRPDGRISLPLLDDIQAAGLTPTQLGNHITEALKKTMRDPQVTVIVTAVNSRRYYV